MIDIKASMRSVQGSIISQTLDQVSKVGMIFS